VLTKNGIHTLANIVITDPMRVDLLPQSYAIQEFATFNAAQTKEKNYYN